MTLRELVVMETGRAQSQRVALLQQANLIGLALFGGATVEELTEFIRCGAMPVVDVPTGEPAMTYDAEALKTAIKEAHGRLGTIKD